MDSFELIAVDEIYPNESNPRFIRSGEFQKLKASIQEFPKMMEIRPIVVDEEGIILGGNQRYHAVKSLGWKMVPVYRAIGLSDEQKKEFIVKDNLHFGDWDWDLLLNQFSDNLQEWGFDDTELAGVEEPEPEKKTKEDVRLSFGEILMNVDKNLYKSFLKRIDYEGNTKEENEAIIRKMIGLNGD